MDLTAKVKQPLAPFATEVQTTEKYRGTDLRSLMTLVASEKRTGQLTIHFTQGGFGFCEWKTNKGESR
jgi:hypothetical protein